MCICVCAGMKKKEEEESVEEGLTASTIVYFFFPRFFFFLFFFVNELVWTTCVHVCVCLYSSIRRSLTLSVVFFFTACSLLLFFSLSLCVF